MRVAIGEIKQESNSFSPLPTTIESFQDGYLLSGDEIVTRLQDTNCEVAGFLESSGVELVPTLAAWSISGGPLDRDAFESLKGDLLSRIQEAGRVDGILLALHGAMLAEGVDDADGEILSELRALCGPGVSIVATLDLHANVTQLMVDNSDLLVPYRTYPHVDQRDTGSRAARLLRRIMNGELEPVTALAKVPLLVPAENQQTTHGPMAQLMQQANMIAAQPGVISASLLPVQPWLDVPDLGFSALVTADRDRDQAVRGASELARATWLSRQTFAVDLTPVQDAVQQALDQVDGPVILADSADGTASGSPGDSTAILHALLQAPLRGPALLTVVDPDAVSAAHRAGLGAAVTLSVGGKIDHIFNKPVDVTAKVTRLISDGRFRLDGPAFTGLDCNMGRVAILSAGEVKIVLMERATWTHDPAMYRAVGLEPTTAQIVVVKSPNLFRAAYAQIARAIILVDGPGTSSSNFSRLPYRRIPRPLYPLDAMDDGDYVGRLT